MRKFFRVLFISCLAFALIGCSNNKTDSTKATKSSVETGSTSEIQPSSAQPTTSSPATSPSTEVATDSVPENLMRSHLTGKWIDKTLGNKAPVAIMINNINEAIPQYGISNADILFEAYAEGGITRLVALFEDYANITKIGSIRSCRTYYLFFAKEFEARYLYYGASKYALNDLAKKEMNSIHLMSFEGTYCYRGTDRPAPHNVYTSGPLLVKLLEATAKNADYPEGYVSPLKFTTDDKAQVTLNGTECTYFAPGYSHNKPYFTYDSDSQTYLRFQFGGAHIDANDNSQLKFKNIIVKYVTGSLWPNGTPNYDNIGKGGGLYITNGKAVDITWEKKTETGTTRYYYSDGTEVTLNQGKTYICYVEDKNKNVITLK